MIVVDTSAIIAIIFAEPERELCLTVIEAADKVLVSSVTVVEARMVTHGRRGEKMLALLNDMLSQPKFEIVAPDQRQADVATNAFITYGKGSGHPAKLNFGDLFAYALAKARGLPLLFKGDDFGHTDIEMASRVTR